MPSLDYAGTPELLEVAFASAEASLLDGRPPRLDERMQEICQRIFDSNTQAYREVLLGCTVARIQDRSIDIRQPYVDQGPNAFSGRSLDERVINPFLQSRRIPCSRGPYLSVFRRSVRFDESTRSGLRDKAGYNALLQAVEYLETLLETDAKAFLRYQLYKFAELREAANIPLSHLQRISLEQYDKLITGLLSTPSGGLFPVLLAVAMFRTIKAFFGVDWDIAWQGINVSDAASGVGGDITISSGGNVLLAVEVTERVVDKPRVETTFNTKIAVNRIEDYLFFTGTSGPSPDARAQAQQYFAQGHEVNFVTLKQWVLMSLATMGKGGREAFNREFLDLLSSESIPKALRVSWNDQISGLLAI